MRRCEVSHKAVADKQKPEFPWTARQKRRAQGGTRVSRRAGKKATIRRKVRGEAPKK